MLREGGKSFLSVIAVAVGIFSVSLISGLGETMEGLVEDKVTEMGLGGIAVYTTDKNESIIDNDILSYVKGKVSDIKGITPLIVESGSVMVRGNSKSAVFLGVNGEIDDVFHIKILHGQLFNHADIAAKARTVIVDSEFAQEHYQRTNIVGKKLILRINSIREEFTVAAVIGSQKKGLETMAGIDLPILTYVPYTVIHELTGTNTSDKVMISCMGNLSESEVAEDTARQLGMVNGIKYKYENINSYISSLWDIVDIIKTFVGSVAGISLLVGGIGIMNSMTYTVDSRKKDIGICMALGERRRSILLRFLSEAVILCGFGGALGILLLEALAAAVNINLGIQLNIPAEILFKNISIAFLCGIIFGILPAYRASRLEPIEIIER
ncbi:MAG: ABC transporter permease [Clostridia bacterium]|nr:ABC transporter permease [Clostridia bacterium]